VRHPGRSRRRARADRDDAREVRERDRERVEPPMNRRRPCP
jgi:hypothetical protein